MEPARRTPEQVVAAARAMDRARAAGLPDDHLQVILAARRAWWSQGDDTAEFAPWPDRSDLQRVIAHPAAGLVDEMVIAAIRRHISGR